MMNAALGKIGAGPRATRRLLVAWTGVCALLLAPLAHAARDGTIDIRSAYTEASEGVLYLSGRVELSLGEEADEALRQGGYYPWDYQPLQKASERYMRNHMDLNVLEENQRFPRNE